MTPEQREANRRACARYRERVRLGLNGTGHSKRKLTDDQVRSVRARFAGGVSLYTLAEEHGVIPLTIERIVKGLTYKNVGDERKAA